MKMKNERPMKKVTVDEFRKNFSHVLKWIKAGEEIAVTRRGQPVAKITALDPKKDIDWPDFYKVAIELKGKPASEIVIEGREDRL